MEPFERFLTTKQEKLRLAIALEEVLAPGLPEEQRSRYDAYLHRRIRPAVQELASADKTAGFAYLAQKGWLDRKLLDEGLRIAVESHRVHALIWLLRYKRDTCGFPDRDLSLGGVRHGG